jgi:hypothetical protein
VRRLSLARDEAVRDLPFVASAGRIGVKGHSRTLGHGAVLSLALRPRADIIEAGVRAYDLAIRVR